MPMALRRNRFVPSTPPSLVKFASRAASVRIGLSVSTPGFARIGEAIAALGVPAVIVQEGGYLCEALPRNLVAFLDGFDEGR